MQLLSSSAILLDAVARAGSFRRAAEALNMSASAINRQILNMEADIGLPLLERLPRGVRPTPVGERLLADIRRWRREQVLAEGQLRELTGQRRGAVSIGATECFSTAVLPDVIRSLWQYHSGLEVSTQFASTEELVRKLVAKELDLALIFNPPGRFAADIVFRLKLRPGLVMATNHPLAGSRNLRLANCLRYGFVLPDSSVRIHEFIESAFSEAHIEVVSPLKSNSIAMMKSMLSNAEMMAILSIFDVHTELTQGSLVFLKIEDSKLEKEELVIAVPSNRRPSPATQAAIALLRAALTDIASTHSTTDNVS